MRIKKTLAAIMVTAMTFACIGCGEKEISFDVKSLAADLNSNIEYDDELMELDADMASNFIDLNGVGIAESAFYEGSGGTAEEIVVLKCNTKEDTQKAVGAFNDRVTEQKEIFKDYAPDEVPKLDNALVISNGLYAVLSVSKDSDKAKDIINGYMK